MSEVRINTPNILDIVHHERRGHTRSNSVGNTLSGGVKIFSRYLRPSLSSCHDFCKFGLERTLEIKARGPLVIPKRDAATLAEGLDVERASISVERKKKLALRLKSFPASKAQKLDFPILNGVVSPLTAEETVFSEHVSPPMKEIEISVIRIEDQKMMPDDDPKMKPSEDPKMKPSRPTQSSLIVERCSNNEGKIKVETSKEKRNSLTNSPRASRSQRRRSKQSSSPKPSTKKFSSRIAENSNYVKGVSHFSNKKTVRKPQSKQPSWKDALEKTLRVVEPNAEDKTPEPIRNVICETNLSSFSFSSLKDKSSEHAQIGSLTAQPFTLSAKRNFRRTQSGIAGTNLPPSHHPSAKQNLRRVQSEIQAVHSPPFCLPFANHQSGTQAANSPPSRPSTTKQSLRHTQSGIWATNSPPSFPPSPGTKGSRGTQLGTRTSSTLTTYSADSSKPGETDTENQTSELKKEYENGPRKGGSIPSKDENIPGKKLTFRGGKVVDLHTVDSTPKRLKFRRNVLGDSQSGKSNASKESLGKKEANTAQLPPSPEKPNSTGTENITLSAQSRLSWPPSPKNKGLRGIQPGIPIARSYSSSSASLSTNREPSSEIGEIDVKNQILDLEQEYKSGPRKEEMSILKDEHFLSQKLTIRTGKKVELHPVDGTPTRLKFKKRVLVDSQNGKGDAGSKAIEKKEAVETQLSAFSTMENFGDIQKRIQSLRLSWPPSHKKKTLRGTELELGTAITRSYSCTSSLELLSMHGDASSEQAETDTEEKILDLENEIKNMLEMDGITSLKEECDLVQRLTFRRGKVVDIIHSDDSAPRRLKFKRRESLLGDRNQNGRGDASRKIIGKEDINDVEGKNSGSLFNNVIEETVSKLVKSRKSKVKALVGAFETVISLQDIKPAY